MTRATVTSSSRARSGAVPATATSASGWIASTGSAWGTRSTLWRARSAPAGGRVPSRELGAVRRALVLRHRAAGDLLLTTPALRALRAGLPSATIDILVARGTEDLLRGNTDVDRVLTLDRRSLLQQASRYADLARGRYDLVIDMVSNPRSAFMAALTRAPIRAGYDIPGRSAAYTVRVAREPRGPEGPIVRYAPEGPLDLIRALGL